MFWVQNQVALLISWKPTGKNPISNVPVLRKYKIIKIPDPSRQKRNALLCRKFSISARVRRTKVQNIESIVLNLDSKPIFWIDCRQHEQCSSYFMKTNNCDTLGSVFDYPGEYVQLPSGVCSTTRWAGNGVIHCGSDPPTSRAGGQDDGSYTNSLKWAHGNSRNAESYRFCQFLEAVFETLFSPNMRSIMGFLPLP